MGCCEVREPMLVYNKNFRLLFLSFLILFSPHLYSNDEEILHAQRIADLWKCREVNLVEHQINQFLTNYPNSPFREQFFAILGDCHYYQKDYLQAIQLYRLVTSDDLRFNIFPRIIDSLIQYNDPTTTIQELKPFVENVDQILSEQQRISTYHYAHALLKRAEKHREIQNKENDLDEAGYQLILLYDDCKNENVDQALYFLSLIINHCPSITYYDYALHQHHCILYTQKKWNEARTHFISFLEKYPNHIYSEGILKRILKCTENELLAKKKSNEDLTLLYSQWIDDLIRIEISDPAKFKEHLKKFEAYSYLKKYQESIDSLKSYIQLSNVNDEKLAYANYLIAKCYLTHFNDYENFIRYAENAMTLNPHFQEDFSLRLHLFHATLSLHNLNTIAEKKENYLNQSIEHLKVAYELNHNELDSDDTKWLFNQLLKKLDLSHKYTFKIFDSFQKNDAKFAIKLFNQIYQNPSHNDLFIFAKLHAGVKNFKKSIAILTKLKNHFEETNDLSKEIDLLMAQIYEKKGDLNQSNAIYAQLIAQNDSPSFQYIGKLCSWSIQLKLCENENQQKELLKELKKLEVRRNFNTEPLHLEAGLYHAFHDLSIDSTTKENKLLENLNKLKHSFSIKEGIVFKDYHLQREKNPEKNKIFDSYIKFIDASIYLLEAHLLEDGEDKKSKIVLSKSLFDELKKSNLQNTLFLPKWIDEALKEYNELFQSY